MILDTTRAFENGNQGVTIYRATEGYMVSVKTPSGGFTIGRGATPEAGLDDALKPAPAKVTVRTYADFDEDILGDLL